jgi:type IV secretory pathway VirB2 component (pilin)
VFLTPGRNRNSYFARLSLLKKLFWLYFFLLIFEGALRKWVAPQLSAPLLIIRDPISLWIIWEAYRSRKWPSRWTVPIVVLTVLMVGLFSLQIVLGDNTFLVGLYGLRSYLLPFPVLFIMGENLDDEDLLRLGRCTLWLLLPMAFLCIGQYLTPPTSFLNRGAYKGAAQIGFGIGLEVRSSGTFSFAAGMVEFATLAGAFIFYGMVREKLAKQWLIWASAFALIVIIPTTGQRALVAQLLAVLGCVAISAMMGLSQFARALRIIVPLLLLSLAASFLPVFNRAMHSMEERFSGATVEEGGTVQKTLFLRAIEPAVNAIDAAETSNNWMGIGLGRGAIAVEAFLSGTENGVTAESNFSHELMEMGPIAGGIFELFKLFLALTMFGMGVVRAREHEPLALLLSPLVCTALLYSLLEQPTLQGFLVIGSAFCIAAAKRPALARIPMSAQMARQQQALEQLLERRRAFQQRRMHRY